MKGVVFGLAKLFYNSHYLSLQNSISMYNIRMYNISKWDWLKNMKNLIIIGAGSFGREVLEYVVDIENKCINDWKMYGFLDDNPNALNEYNVGYPIIDSLRDYKPRDNDIFVSAFGDGKDRVKYANIIRERGGKFTSIIHPTARILHRVRIGEGSIISFDTLIANDTECGDFLYLNYGGVVGHDNHLGTGCTLNSYCITNGHCTLGDYVYMGAHAVIVPGKKVGNNSRIAAGAAVFKNIKDNITVFGNPARKLL